MKRTFSTFLHVLFVFNIPFTNALSALLAHCNYNILQLERAP